VNIQTLIVTLPVAGISEIQVSQIGAPGANGKSAYQSYLDSTADDPPLTEEEWSAGTGGASAFVDLTDKATADLPAINGPLASALAGKSSTGHTHDYSAVYQPLNTRLTSISGLTYTGNQLKVLRVNAAESAFELVSISVGGGDALVANSLDQFADVTQAAGKTLSITESTTLAGGTHSGTNTGDQDLSAYAPLANPTFTGVPAGPTAAPGTNTTQLATTAFIQAALAALINSAPGALDTLDELAAAMGDDANFAATVTTALAGKQPLDATLTALAALTTAADKLIYATGSDTFATADLTAFGRQLAAAANAAAVISLLSLGTAATKNTGTTSGTIPEFGTGGSLALASVSISGETSYGNSAYWTYGTGRAAEHRTALKVPASDNTGITGADALSNMVSLTQAEYDAIGTPNATTLYFIP
jgi:hypothetical protein